MNPTIIDTHVIPDGRGQIHLYRPENTGDRLLPFVIGVHGGGWRNGDQTSLGWMWNELQPIGAALVLVSYRLAPEHPFPCAYDDLCAVLAWLKECGESVGLDPSNALLLGSSAGGHLVMLLATRALKEGRPMPTLHGVAEYCGIMDLEEQYRHDLAKESNMTQNFLGMPPEGNGDVYRSASPIHHIHNTIPPIWAAHGTKDSVVPVGQSRAMIEKLREAGVSVIYQEAEGAGHTMVEPVAEKKEGDPVRFLFRDSLFQFIRKSLA